MSKDSSEFALSTVVQPSKRYSVFLYDNVTVASTPIGWIDVAELQTHAIQHGMRVEVEWNGKTGVIEFRDDSRVCKECGRAL